MRFYRWVKLTSLGVLLAQFLLPTFAQEGKKVVAQGSEGVITLPPPRLQGKVSVEEALAKRASVREFSREPLKYDHISQLLWAAQGITRPWGGRTTPSAGALYPLEIYVALPQGVFHYQVKKHQLVRHLERNAIPEIAQAALGQGCVRHAPLVVVITAVYDRVGRKYGARAERYVKMEVGHAAQNILLEAVSMELCAVPVGAFHDEKVRDVLKLPSDHEPLYLIPVGYPAGGER